jgi:hypothetical protein
MRGWIFRIGIIAVIAIGAFVFRDRLSGNAGELKVGDCFDDPAGVTEVTDVQHHPCTEAHNAEVIHIGDLPGDDATYASEATIDTFIESNCLTAWQAYTGKSYEEEVVLGLGYYIPSDEGWKEGDRQVICYAAREDGAPMTTSVKKAP